MENEGSPMQPLAASLDIIVRACGCCQSFWTDAIVHQAEMRLHFLPSSHWLMVVCMNRCKTWHSHSASMPISLHFLSRHSWHFLRMYMSISQFPPLLHLYTAFFVMLLLKKPEHGGKTLSGPWCRRQFDRTEAGRCTIEIRRRTAIICFSVERTDCYVGFTTAFTCIFNFPVM